jgi:hypothetical protein
MLRVGGKTPTQGANGSVRRLKKKRRRRKQKSHLYEV